MNPFQERFLEIPGARIHCIVHEGQGPPVVILDGGPGLPMYLHSIEDMLAGDYQLYLYSQRGTGKSTSNGPFTWKDHVADLEALRIAWKLNHMALLGHSWGGQLALLYAVQYHERVSKVILVNPVTVAGEKYRRFLKEFDRSITGRISFLTKLKVLLPYVTWQRNRGTAKATEVFKRILHISLKALVLDPSKAPDLTDYIAGYSDIVAYQTDQSLLQEEAETALVRGSAKLTMPVLSIYGRYDNVPAWNQDILKERIPHVKVVVFEKSAHFAYHEEPELFRQTVLEFLKEA